MAITRLYYNHTLQVGSDIVLTDDAHHKLANVLRAKVGQHLWLFNGELYDGKEGDFFATITSLNKKNLTVMLTEFIQRNTESPIFIAVAQALPKAEKMDFILQKAVELGANHFVPLITERTNMRLTKEQATKKHHHWQAVIQHACEQSGRNRIPGCEMPMGFADWMTHSRSSDQDEGQRLEDLRLILQPTTQANLTTILAMSSLDSLSKSKITICIGPEGGLTQEEVLLAEQHGFHMASLGPRVLRTETASLALLSILQFYYGDLGNRVS